VANTEQLVAEFKKNGTDAIALQADVSDPEQPDASSTRSSRVTAGWTSW
jgi:hypothetical protein